MLKIFDSQKNPIHYTVVITGDEILSGKRHDRHFSFITSTLSTLGLECQRGVFVGDHDATLSRVLKEALEETPLVIVTGGLGPTLDDITREALSEVMNIPLNEDPKALEDLISRFKEIGRPMTDNNRRQALVPTRGTFFSNPNGTAPGLVYDLGDRIAIALPGPPRELEPMFHNSLVPYLYQRFDLHQSYLTSKMRFCCLGESNIDSVVREKVEIVEGIRISSISSVGTVDLTLSLPDNGDSNRLRLQKYVDSIRESIGEYIYTYEDESLPEVVGNLLRQRGETLALAESCTGGLLGSQITSVPGSSDFFWGGVIAYNNSVKELLLCVDHTILEEKGAVSRETACLMAEGIRSTMKSTWGIGITGIAGPGGGTEEKPVGTVWIAVAKNPEAIYPVSLKLFGSREAVRQRSCVYALDQIRRLLLQLPVHL